MEIITVCYCHRLLLICGDQVLRYHGVIVYCRGHGSFLSCCDCGVAMAAAAAAAADSAAVAVSAATMRPAAELLLQKGTLSDYFNNTHFMKLIETAIGHHRSLWTNVIIFDRSH